MSQKIIVKGRFWHMLQFCKFTCRTVRVLLDQWFNPTFIYGGGPAREFFIFRVENINFKPSKPLPHLHHKQQIFCLPLIFILPMFSTISKSMYAGPYRYTKRQDSLLKALYRVIFKPSCLLKTISIVSPNIIHC